MTSDLHTTYRPIAHAAKDPATGLWREPHDLAEHLQQVSRLAADFARSYGADWARLAGLWHDLGKYRPRFQNYIRKVTGFEEDAHIQGEAGKAPHSTAGALLACDKLGLAGHVLAYLIAGHHAGLSDWHGGLRERLKNPNSRAELDEALAATPPAQVLSDMGLNPDLRSIPGGRDGFALWVRMLFSALVDADFLDTERYMSPDKFISRNTWPRLIDLAPRFDAHMDDLSNKANPTPVNALRADILRQCRDKARLDPGLFSLTVPTGGGKTLSAMAFALEHARLHGKGRVMHVIPYTSIIEQTAEVFRSIFGETVIEHHSNAEADPTQENAASRLACENWDAPIIVTTSVQLFESLFAARTSRCRKLHNLVDSIIVLDEAQLLPPKYLQPILDVLNLLTLHYGVTLILSTATQPALSSSRYLDARQNLRGLEQVREIIDDPDALYRALERVEVKLPDDLNRSRSWEELAQDIQSHQSVLAIVNTRKDAREFWQLMPKGTLHLSALMCGAHRSEIIHQIKTRLDAGLPTRVISTQLIEAGVDVDFPVVYRALAGLDSIAQSAGRCNREGKLKTKGKVSVFVPPKAAPPGLLRQGQDATKNLLLGLADQDRRQPLTRMAFDAYFKRLYYGCNLDEAGICQLLTVDSGDLGINFRAAADQFKLIDDEDSATVIVRHYGNNGQDKSIDKWLNTLRKEGPQRWLMRKLQRYSVNLHQRDLQRLLAQGDIEEAFPGLYIQTSDWLYDSLLGLNPDGVPIQPHDTIV